MSSIDSVKEIASSLDLFFKGLTACGLLKAYKVQFLEKNMLDNESRLRFRSVVLEFLTNMQKSLQNSLDEEEFVDSVCYQIPNFDGLVEPEMLFLVPEDTELIPQSSVVEEKQPNTHVESPERPTEAQTVDEDDDSSLKNKRLDDVLRMIYSNKEKNDISEPWQVSILGNQGIDATIDTITEVMTKNHMRDEKWRCDMCDKIFSRMHLLQDHCRAEHDGTGCFECNLCGARVMSKLSLRRHIRSHSGIKTNVCDICHKIFRRADYLATHYKQHFGARTHRCETCAKEFTSKTGLQLHERVHSEQKDYTCHQCNKSFARRDKLRDHVLRHLNIKRFQCSVCARKYAEKRDLRSHLKTHF